VTRRREIAASSSLKNRPAPGASAVMHRVVAYRAAAVQWDVEKGGSPTGSDNGGDRLVEATIPSGKQP